MKKVIFVLLLCIAGFTAAAYQPARLPSSLQKPFWWAHHQLRFSENVQQSKKPYAIYKSKTNDGRLEFSDKLRAGSTVHECNNGAVFIDMSHQAHEKSHANDVEDHGTSGISAVLDPVNSINNEAAANVEKMRQKRQEQLAEQGL